MSESIGLGIAGFPFETSADFLSGLSYARPVMLTQYGQAIDLCLRR